MRVLASLVLTALSSLVAADYGDPRSGKCATGEGEPYCPCAALLPLACMRLPLACSQLMACP